MGNSDAEIYACRSSGGKKIPDKCVDCAALSAAQAKALHGVDGDKCWDSQVCPSRRSYIRHRDRRNQARSRKRYEKLQTL